MAVKDFSIKFEDSQMRPALKYAMRHWAEHSGLVDHSQWPLAENYIDDDFIFIFNKVKHYWRLPEGYQLVHGLAEKYISRWTVDSDIVGVSDDGWALRDSVPNSNKAIYNAHALCDMLIKGIDSIYNQALTTLES